MSAPCAKYSLPISAYSEPTLTASLAFSLRTSAYSDPTLAASAAFSLRISVAS